ncbi:drebrin-like protein A [Conger conger]|uniref:drebrin-like protein A n=1 Tax=Conger conger TaxID=82655 RepID=UPI002A5A2BB3|nr:drebrin-like protein A [Conger conger]
MKAINLDTYNLSLLTAKEDILNPRSSTNWALFTYVGITNNLKLSDSGVGGVNELAGKFHVKRPLYGLCRVGMGGQGPSRIVMIIWVGEEMDQYRRAECASHVPAIKAFFKEAHIFVNASRPEDVTEEHIRAIISKFNAPKERVQRDRLSADKEETVGTNYKRTIAAMEIRRISRDSFWARAEKEEEDRKEEECRRAIEDRRRRERERILQERREAEERERKMNEKQQMIRKQRKLQAEVEAEAQRQEKLKWEQQQMEREEEMRASFRHSESIEKAAEAAALVSQRSMNPREFFRQLSSSSSRSPSNPGSPRTVRPPFRRYQRSLTDTAFIFGGSGSFTPPSSPRSPFSRTPTSPSHRSLSPPSPGGPDPTFQPIASPHPPQASNSPPPAPACSLPNLPPSMALPPLSPYPQPPSSPHAASVPEPPISTPPAPACSLPNLPPSTALPPLSPPPQPSSSPHATSIPEPQISTPPAPVPSASSAPPGPLPSLSEAQLSSLSPPGPLESPPPEEAPSRPLPESLEAPSLQAFSEPGGHEPPFQIPSDPQVQVTVVEEEEGEVEEARDSEEKTEPHLQASETAADLTRGERSPVGDIPPVTVEETVPALHCTSPGEEDPDSEAESEGEASADDGNENGQEDAGEESADDGNENRQEDAGEESADDGNENGQEDAGEASAEDGNENGQEGAGEESAQPSPSLEPVLTGEADEGVELAPVCHPSQEPGATGEAVDDGDLSQCPAQDPSSLRANGMCAEPGERDEKDENGVSLEPCATGENLNLSQLDGDSGLSPSTRKNDGIEEVITENQGEVQAGNGEEIHKYLDTDGQLRVRALHYYQAEHESELSLEPGDIISVLETVDKAWWRGYNKDGRRGLFPASYVETI